MPARITQKDLDAEVESIRVLMDLLEMKPVELVVRNPYGPTGMHLLEVGENNSVNQSTVLGFHRWETKRDAFNGLRCLKLGLRAAHLSARERLSNPA